MKYNKSPKILFFIIGLAIFTGEIIAALLSEAVLHFHYRVEAAALHGVLLCMILYPLFFLLFLRPVILRQKEVEIMKNALGQEKLRIEEYFNVAAAIIVSIGSDEMVDYINRRGCETLGYECSEVAGKNWFDNFLPQGTREKERSYFLDSIKGIKPIVDYFESPVLTKSGTEKAIGWYRTVFKDVKGNITGILRSGHDLASLRRTKDALMKRDYQLEILTRNSVHLSGARDVESILRNLVTAAVELVDAGAGADGLIENGKIVVRDYVKDGRSETVHHLFEPGRGIAGWVLDSKRPYFTNEANKYSKAIPLIEAEFDVRNLIDVPFIGRNGEILGCLEVYNKAGHRLFDVQDVIILQGLAASGAVALESMQSEISKGGTGDAPGMGTPPS